MSLLPHAAAMRSAALAPARCICARAARGPAPRMGVRARSQGPFKDQAPNEEQLAQMKAQYEEAMKDPTIRDKMAQVQEMMKNPGVLKEMQAMQAAMSTPGFQEKVAALKDDPEFKEMFDDIKSNGMGAIMKYYNDPKWVAKIAAAVGSPGAAPEAAAAAPAAAAAAPEVDNLIDAAKVGDMEAVEDFIAVGKDLNMTDAEGRTPLHFACAYNRLQVVSELLTAGAELEISDSKNNTPLHYAAGYGRAEAVRMLLEAGASTAAQNATGKTPLDLVKLSDQNPLNADEDLCFQLEPKTA
ncbi:unnamed protein product [Pedinophyceae sp. YPF-701]|nr:unnamed protein product [Pedinophyceae sp. YPF-701]